MLEDLKEKFQAQHLRHFLSGALLISSFLFIGIAVVAYLITERDLTVGLVVGSALFANILNLITLIGNQCDSYFTVYIFWVLTLMHFLVNVLLTFKFPLLMFPMAVQALLVLIAYFHCRELRNKVKKQYQQTQFDS